MIARIGTVVALGRVTERWQNFHHPLICHLSEFFWLGPVSKIIPNPTSMGNHI